MNLSRLRSAAALLALALPLTGCDSIFGPQDTALRVSMGSQTGSSVAAALLAPSFSLSEAAVPGGRPGNGPVSLESIESIKVGLTQVLILPGATDSAAGAEANEDGESKAWVPLTVVASELDLLALKNQETLAELSADAGITGPIEAVRLVFGASSVVFKDGKTESLFIPSGKVTLRTPGLVVDEAATTLPLTFLQSASVKKIIRTGRGLLMPPVFDVAGTTQADSDED